MYSIKYINTQICKCFVTDMKKRLIFYDIQPYLEHKNAIVITGMRQVGKTVLMKQLFDEIEEQPRLWFDFDNPIDQKIFEDIEYNNIYKRLVEMSQPKVGRLYVFLDEIQNFPEITKVIKYLIDHYGVKFVVTGSSSFYLKNLFPESLSGRKFLYTLTPLTFKEYLYFSDVISLEDIRKSNNIDDILEAVDLYLYKKYEVFYDQYLEYGGFPEVITTQDIQTKKMVLSNIFISFFEKDLKNLSDYGAIRQLRDLILLLVPRVGSMIDVSRIARELSIDRSKVYNLLEFLQGTFFIKLLPKFSRSIDRSVAGGRKIYFSDTGILQSIGKVNEWQLFENAVVNQLSAYGNLSFYNKRNTAEIDLILNKKIAFEIKLTGVNNDLKKLHRLSRDIGIEKYYVVSKNYVGHNLIISPINL